MGAHFPRLTRSHRHNGYIHSTGDDAARAAVASYYNESRDASSPRAPVTRDDVCIASGASSALDLAIGVLLNPGDVLFVPRPGFPLYTTLCEARGIRAETYALDPARNWEADTDALSRAMTSAISGGSRVALLINNPSNPCGSVFSAAHVRALLATAVAARVPVISDEIYARVVFGEGVEFVSAANASADVPLLVVGGTAKEFMVPGWRVGWVVMYDVPGCVALRDVRKGIGALAQLTLGANALILAALPAVLSPVSNSAAAIGLAAWRAATLAQLSTNARAAQVALSSIPGISVNPPAGAMYLLFSVPRGSAFGRDDGAFARALLAEENVFVLPGSAFGAPGFCRVVFTAPLAVLEDAFSRMRNFCARHVGT